VNVPAASEMELDPSLGRRAPLGAMTFVPVTDPGGAKTFVSTMPTD
jgi:hypothetical protein